MNHPSIQIPMAIGMQHSGIIKTYKLSLEVRPVSDIRIGIILVYVQTSQLGSDNINRP